MQAGTYNTRRLIPEVLVSGDRWSVVRPRPSYEELIGLASAILRSVNHERPVALPGASKADVVANIAAVNTSDPAGEPLAEIGVAPAGQGNAAATTPASARH